jgi:hypothetical protein
LEDFGTGGYVGSRKPRRSKMIIYLSLLVAVIGLLIYVLAKDGKVVELGRLMFGIGLLCFLLQDAALLTILRK